MFKRGDQWYSDFWHGGKRYKKSWGAISKTIAKEKDRQFRTEVAEGRHEVKAKRILFETFSTIYLEAAKMNKKPKSATRNDVSINMLKPFFGSKLLKEIHPLMAEQYKKARKEAGKSPGTINRDITTLKNMLKKATEWGYLRSNPLAGVKTFKEDNDRMWALSATEEAKLIMACAKSPQRGKKRYLQDLVLFALNSGMRLAEIFSLEKSNVHLDERFIQITDTKNHDPRKVPINDTLKRILEKRMKEESQYVFCTSKGKQLTVLTNAFWFAAKQAGLTRHETIRGKLKTVRFRFHDLRHTFGSRLGMAGVDLKTIMEIMGHKTAKVALRYQHPAPDHKLNAVRILDQISSEIENGSQLPPKVPPGEIYDVKTGRKISQVGS